MRKKGMELSINFVVMLILALAVFSLGLVFISKLFGKAEDIKLTLDAESERELKSILSGGSQIAIYPSNVEVKRGKYEVAGIGVLNSLLTPGGPNNDFEMNVRFVKALDKNDGVMCEQGVDEGDCAGDTGDVDLWMYTDQGAADPNDGASSHKTIPKNNQEEILCAFSIPRDASIGTFIFSVNITYDAGGSYAQYGNPNRIYIKIK